MMRKSNGTSLSCDQGVALCLSSQASASFPAGLPEGERRHQDLDGQGLPPPKNRSSSLSQAPCSLLQVTAPVNLSTDSWLQGVEKAERNQEKVLTRRQPLLHVPAASGALSSLPIKGRDLHFVFFAVKSSFVSPENLL